MVPFFRQQGGEIGICRNKRATQWRATACVLPHEVKKKKENTILNKKKEKAAERQKSGWAANTPQTFRLQDTIQTHILLLIKFFHDKCTFTVMVGLELEFDRKTRHLKNLRSGLTRFRFWVTQQVISPDLGWN